MHYEITFPTDEATVRELRAGDTVTLQGHIIGIRDATQIRIFDKGVAPPMSLEGAALLHTAPNVRKLADGSYEPMCIGTTTSARMSRFTEGLIRDHGARAIMGKGGLLPEAVGGLVEGAQFTPSLTTVSQPLGELGQLAVREMLRLVAEEPGHGITRSATLATELIIRASAPAPPTSRARPGAGGRAAPTPVQPG